MSKENTSFHLLWSCVFFRHILLSPLVLCFLWTYTSISPGLVFSLDIYFYLLWSCAFFGHILLSPLVLCFIWTYTSISPGLVFSLDTYFYLHWSCVFFRHIPEEVGVYV